MSKLQVDQVSKTSAGAATFVLPAADGAADTFLKTDGSGALSFATAGGSNTPYFYAYLGSDQAPADDTWTKVNIDTVSFQTGSTYNTTDKRWTPAVAGKYFLHIEGILRADSSNKLSNSKAAIYKNGAVAMFYEGAGQPENTLTNCGISASAILDLDADDYVEFWARVNVYSGTASIAATGGVAQATHFMGFKLVD